MTEQNKVRILWLSDIHFRSSYDEEVLRANAEREVEKVRKEYCGEASKVEDRTIEIYGKRDEALKQIMTLDAMLDAFHLRVAECVKKEKIDYVLISGDLAFAASDEDYSLFEKKVTKRLREICGAKTRFLSVPGNHDVDWRGTGFFDTFISQMFDKSEEQIRDEYFMQRKNFMSGKNDLFRTIFQNYTAYFNSNILPSLDNLDVCNDYKKHGLFGLVIDRPNNLVINLLNSSWYALGQQFDNLLTDAIMRQYQSLFRMYFRQETTVVFAEKFRTFVHFLIVLKSVASEYGEQILGESLMKSQARFDKLEEHQGAFVLSVFHHPMNWLQFGEKYNMNSEDYNALFLTRLLAYTDMLITGHEHVPASTISEKINRHIHHLKAGMFMQDNLFTSEIEGEHRFSILEVDTKKFHFSEIKYIYNWIDKKFEDKEKYAIVREPTRLKRPALTACKHQILVEKLTNPAVVKAIMANFFWIDDDSSLLQRKEELDSSFFKCFSISGNGELDRRLLLLVTDHAFFGKIFPSELTTSSEAHPLDEIVKSFSGDEGPVLVHIVSPDFLVDPGLTENYYKELPVNEVYTSIVRKADFIFNVARHHFFNRFERVYRSAKDMSPIAINGIGFEQIREMRVTCQIIPFWSIERYG